MNHGQNSSLSINRNRASRRRSRRCTHHASRLAAQWFTLIELLVVIAIIAILASMLLPALSRAKQAGQNVVCVSQEKQMAIATLMYVGDHDTWIPPGYAYDSWTPTDLETRLANEWYWPFRLLPYLANGEAVFDCPISLKYPVLNTYAANGVFNMFVLWPESANVKATRLAQIKRPTRVPFFWEQTSYDTYAPYAALSRPLMFADVELGFYLDSGGSNMNAGRHFRGGGWGYDNIVFVDGHVRPKVSMLRLASWLNGSFYYSYPLTLGYNNPQVLPDDSEFHTYFGN